MRGHLPRLILLAVLIIASVAAAFYTWRARDALEGFDDEEAKAVIADGGTSYEKRIYIMKIFDALLKRKATAAELDQYSQMDSDAEILSAVIARYKGAGAGRENAESYTDTEPAKGSTKDAHAHAHAPAKENEKVKEKEKEKANEDKENKEKENKEKEKEKEKESGAKTVEKKSDDRVCMNKQDLLRNLNDITDRVSRFQSLVNSL